MDEFDLLQDAVALIDAFEPFPLDLDGGGALSPSPLPPPPPPRPMPSSFCGASPLASPSLGNDADRRPECSSASPTSSTASSSLSPVAADAHGGHATRMTMRMTMPSHNTATTANHDPHDDGHRPPAKNASRERLKAELIFLRGKVIELERELGALRHEHEARAVARTSTALAPVWRRMAERQLARRRTAEIENERLKAVLDGQIRVARSLEQMLRKRSSAAMIDLYEGARGPSLKRPRAAVEGDLEALYALFLPDIDRAFQSTDHVFAVNGLDRTFDETVRGYAVKTRRRGDGREQLFMELQDIKLVPFALDRAIQAVWTAVSGEFTGRSRVIESCHSLDDRFAVRYQTRSHALAKEGVLNVGMVMKRFRTPTHMVLVWRATNSCGDDHQEWQNHYTEETGWIVVKRVPTTATTGLEPETSVMQSCVHLLPRWVTSADTEQFLRQTKAGDFTKLVMNAYESVVVGITETIENLLVDESLGLVGGGPSATFSPGR